MQGIIRPAVETLIGRTYANAGAVELKEEDRQERGDRLEVTGTLLNKTHGEEVKIAWLFPKQMNEWNGRVVVWLGDGGRAALHDEHVLKLVRGGTEVVGADLLFQGGNSLKQTRVVANPREFAGYTFGYNHALFAQRTHDVLTIVAYLRKAPVGPRLRPKSVAVAGWGQAGPIVAAARALAGRAIDRAAVDTGGFRFGKLLDYRDPMFLPGGAKYLDVPGMIALNAPHPLWLAGEGGKPEVFGAKFTELTTFAGTAAEQEAAAVEWLLK